MMKRFLALSAVSLMAMAAPALATCKYNCGPQNTSGSGSAYFGGELFSENMAGALGDLTIAQTENWKEEVGGAGVDTGTGGPTTAYGFAHLATGGSGMSAALSMGHGPSIANSGVGGALAGNVFAGFQVKK
jgi:hypothetical protein